MTMEEAFAEPPITLADALEQVRVVQGLMKRQAETAIEMARCYEEAVAEVTAERDAAMAELESRRQEVALLGADFVAVSAERDAAKVSLDESRVERNATVRERNAMLDAILAERDALAAALDQLDEATVIALDNLQVSARPALKVAIDGARAALATLASGSAAKERTRGAKFLCIGCRQWRPFTQGGAPDVRCDTCVVASGSPKGDGT